MGWKGHWKEGNAQTKGKLNLPDFSLGRLKEICKA
jgi:hypothetical protein